MLASAVEKEFRFNYFCEGKEIGPLTCGPGSMDRVHEITPWSIVDQLCGVAWLAMQAATHAATWAWATEVAHVWRPRCGQAAVAHESEGL